MHTKLHCRTRLFPVVGFLAKATERTSALQAHCAKTDKTDSNIGPASHVKCADAFEQEIRHGDVDQCPDDVHNR